MNDCTSSSHRVHLPEYPDILHAYKRIRTSIHKTPVLTSETYNQRFGSSLFFKCENFQKSGSFKFRGAMNALLQLTEDEILRGVATHSSGNHGQAVAKAAKIRGCRSVVVMPENAPTVKVDAVKNYGGEVLFCKPTLESRENTLQQLIEREGLVVIHPFADPRVIAGQGTVALELMLEVPDLDLILMPIGGGGLISGCSLASHNSTNLLREVLVMEDELIAGYEPDDGDGSDSEHKPDTEHEPHREHEPNTEYESNTGISSQSNNCNPGIRIIGTEPEMANDAFRSFHSGVYTTTGNQYTIADGLRATIGRINYEMIQRYVSDIISVKESAIIREMKTFWERMNLIIEPSCAVPLAALPSLGDKIRNKRVGIIITGGNLDLNHLPWMGQNK